MSLCWVAVVTETSSSIGVAVAHSLASALARVALAARRQYELLAVQAGLDGQGDEVRGLRMPNKTSLRQLRVDLGHAVRSASHRSFRFP